MEKEAMVLDVLTKSEAPLKSAQIAEIANMDKKVVGLSNKINSINPLNFMTGISSQYKEQ